MKEVSVVFKISKDDCTKCRFHFEEEEMEVGMSPNSHHCGLFFTELESGPIPCGKCKRLFKSGRATLS
jgi:hypothetical protein